MIPCNASLHTIPEDLPFSPGQRRIQMTLEHLPDEQYAKRISWGLHLRLFSKEVQAHESTGDRGSGILMPRQVCAIGSRHGEGCLCDRCQSIGCLCPGSETASIVRIVCYRISR